MSALERGVRGDWVVVVDVTGWYRAILPENVKNLGSLTERVVASSLLYLDACREAGNLNTESEVLGS